MKTFITLLVILSTQAFASNAPANFPSSQDQHSFVDFDKAHYSIKYDVANQKASVYTTITFTQKEAGLALFDLIPDTIEAKLDGENVTTKVVSSPDNVTKYRAINKSSTAGVHTLEIKNEFTSNLKFEENGVQSAFWMSDLSDRKYLEQYIPSNIEFDQYKMTMDVTFANTTTKQTIYTNGNLTLTSTSTNSASYRIEFPEYFTASSMFFHTATEGRFTENRFDYTSVNGKVFPVTIYSGKSLWSDGTANVRRATEGSKKVLAELEKKLGAWSHENLVVYVAGSGGMEHSGATITSMNALGHEITHSYFARGVMPIDGNAGWMDEAIASWRDAGYKEANKPNFSSTSMAAHSEYRRTTDRKAYTQGANFMAYLNYNLKNQGGLIKFLSMMHTKYTHKNIDTELFRSELETHSGLNFEADFNKYIYGQGKADNSKAVKDNPFHPKLSKQELLDLL
jgi:hypothetical protein